MNFLTSLMLLAVTACTTAYTNKGTENNTAVSPPKNYAVVLFPSFDSLDVFGPLEPLWWLSFQRQLNLYLIAETLEPVWVEPASHEENAHNSSFWFSVNPTHTFANPPSDIDVLLVPGGMGGQLTSITTHTDFIRNTYPDVKYLISVCTGAGVVARTGLLDGRNATTNKKVWDMVTALGPNVNWKSPARWVVDGNIWSSSGITAGIDLIFAFIEEMYGVATAWDLQAELEHERKGMCDDVWSEIQGVEKTWECVER